ncbi:glycosyltransferase family 4 protein, partial [Streptomyces syringium]
NNDGVDGLLVPTGKVDKIAAGLLKLINDDELRQRMGREALSSSARFDPAHVAGRYEELFSDLTRRGGLRGSLHRTRGALLSSAFQAKDASRSALRKVRA